MTENKNFYYGAHLSIKNGILNTIDEINEIKGNMIQIFISNPMSTKFVIDNTKFNKKQGDIIKSRLKETNTKIVIHLPYVINLGRSLTNNPMDCWWISMICNQLLVSDMIGSIGCVVHVGKYLDLTESEGLDNMYDGLAYVIEFIRNKSLDTKIILETAAGQGTELITTKNNSLKDFAEFYNRFNDDQKKHIKICVDTCHIFAAGFDIRQKFQVKQFFEDFDRLIGIKNIILIHLNDSKASCGSCKDRHENLGQGMIGLHGIKHVIRYAAFYKIPIVLETPDGYVKEIELISNIKKEIDKIL